MSAPGTAVTDQTKSGLTTWFWVRLVLFSGLFAVCFAILPSLIDAVNFYSTRSVPNFELARAHLFVAIFGIIVSAIGTVCTIVFAWRTDRRAVKDLELKIKDLELKIAAAQAKEPLLPPVKGDPPALLPAETRVESHM
jgi:hypothetical protein